MVKRLSVAFIACSVLAGCVATLGDIGNSWKGAPVNEFIDRAGIPIRSVSLPDGRIACTLGNSIRTYSDNAKRHYQRLVFQKLRICSPAGRKLETLMSWTLFS